jgi:hypothetical protein
MDEHKSEAPRPQTPRPRLQFSLLSLFLLTLLVALGCSALFGLSDSVAAPVVAGAAILVPVFLITVVIYSRTYWQTFCVGALVPCMLVVYFCGWISMLTCFDPGPLRLSDWPRVAQRLMIFYRPSLLFSWSVAVVAGLLSVVVRWLIDRKRGAPQRG